MTTYASADDLWAYVEDNPDVEAPTEDAAERLLERAERDVDRLLGPRSKSPTSGLRIDPNEITVAQQDALARAVCAQAEWRLMMGEEEIVGADDGVISTGDLAFNKEGLPRPPGPKVIEELAGFGLLIRSGTVSPEDDAAE